MKAERSKNDRLLTFLLLPAVVIAVLVLSSFSFRASFQLEKLREQSVVEATLELANERAGRLDQMIIGQDSALGNEVDVASLETLAKSWLPLAARQTPTVRAVLVLDLSSPDREVLAFASRAPGPEDDEFRRMLIFSLLGRMELEQAPQEQLRHLHDTEGNNTYLLSYWQRRLDGRRFLVVAWHDVARIVHDYLPGLYPERDSQSRVNVVDGEGRIVFGPPLSEGEFTVGLPFQTTLYKWRLNVALTSAEELAASAARRRMIETVLAGLSGLVVLSGIIVILVAVARERKLSNLKSEFVANVSHELKTPLSLVRMFGELLHSGRVESEEKRQHYLQIIVNESERLGALIENVLDFARVERGKDSFDFKSTNLAEVAARVLDLCRARVEREGLSLDLEIKGELPEVSIDQHAIEVAILNLVDNAVKYAASGKVIRIEIERRGELVQIRVEDRGPGIALEDRRRIFDRFVRGKAATRIRGSGIGLALVKQIALAHGGDAGVNAAEPTGSVFFFTIRIGRPPSSNGKPRVSSSQ